MKLPLLVSLPLLASTNVTLAKSTLNEGRQNVTDSLDMSPRRLSSVRNLMQSTTSGTRHQAENAEERAPSANFEKLAHNAPALLGKSRSFEDKQLLPEVLFLKLDFKNKDDLIKSQAFRMWVQAVKKSNSGNADRTIIESLLQNIPVGKLYTMLEREKGKALSVEQFDRLFASLVSHLRDQRDDPNFKWRNTMQRIELEPETPATRFQKLNLKINERLFRSQAFKEWMLAVENSNKEDAGKTISEVLLQNIAVRT